MEEDEEVDRITEKNMKKKKKMKKKINQRTIMKIWRIRRKRWKEETWAEKIRGIGKRG